MDLKLKDHIVVNEAMGKKSNMDGDQLTDFDKTELRTKSQIGCPNIGALPWNLTTPIETDANSSEFIKTSGVDFTN